MKILSVLFVSVFSASIACAQAVTNTTAPQQEKSVPASVPAEAEEESIEMNTVKEISVESKKKSEKRSEIGTKSLIDSETVVKQTEFNMQQQEFNASRQQVASQRTQRTPTVDFQKNMDNAVEFFETNAPQSFEYHYFKYLSGNHDVALKSHLFEAERLRPENSDVQVQLIALHMIEAHEESAQTYLKKIYINGRLPESAVQYAEDVLRSCPQGGLLISHAFEDSYAIWYQQLVNGIRKDVKVISLDLMQSKQYRDRLRNEALLVPEMEIIGIDFVKELLASNAVRTPALAMTIPKEYFSELLPHLYVQGLSFLYDPKGEVEINNPDLWNNGLKKHLITDAKDEKGKQLSANYLPLMLAVRTFYENQNDEVKVVELDQEIAKVVVQSKKQSAYSKVKD